MKIFYQQLSLGLKNLTVQFQGFAVLPWKSINYAGGAIDSQKL